MLGATFILLFILLVTTILWIVHRFFADVESRLTKLPGLRPQWLFGSLKNTGITSGRLAFHEVLASMKATYGDAFSFWFGPHYGIVLSRIEHVQYVLANRQIYDQADITSSAFAAMCPSGLIALRGDRWKHHARFILPMFRRSRVVCHVGCIVSYVDHWIDKQLSANDRRIHADLVNQCQRLFLNIIARVAFDYDLEAATAPGYNLHEAFSDFVHYANQFVLMGGIPKWLGHLILMVHVKFQRARRIVKHHILDIIARERKRQQQISSECSKPQSLVAALVAAVKEESSSTRLALTSNELFDEISLSVIAGFETGATVLSWFIFYMSKYPHVQERIKEELRENHVTHDAELNQQLLDSLVYVECVVKEVLRFAPISPGVIRQAMQDDVIDSIPVSKGDNIMIATHNLHRDPRYWNIDPANFVPERFLDEDKYPLQNVYMPFGGGHRACAGQDLALLELKTIITRLMQRVTFEDPGDEADNSGGYNQCLTCLPKHLAVRIHLDSGTTAA